MRGLIPLLVSLLMFGAQCSKSQKGFYRGHFEKNLAAQGQPPSHFTDLEKSLEPTSCKTCHLEQYQKWSQSLHSKSMDVGLKWELPSLSATDRENCFRCHSPLFETREMVKESLGLSSRSSQHWAEFLSQKQENHGLLCASCHVRNHKRLGPVPRQSKLIGQSPHNGFIIKSQFSSSEFCKSCHESPPNGQLVAQKRMMETYSEWKASRFSKNGTECQTCHMPNRAHVWKGIHDREFVLSGLTIDWKAIQSSKPNQTKLIGTIESSYIGHKFPTYMIPLIQVRILGQRENGTNEILEESLIGRHLDIHLTEEFFDTRLKPGEVREWFVEIKNESLLNYKQFIFEALVEPDEMYIRKFEHNQKEPLKSQRSASQNESLDLSLIQKKASGYLLFSKTLEIESLKSKLKTKNQ